MKTGLKKNEDGPDPGIQGQGGITC